MASLLEIGRDGIGGVASSPVDKVAINNYAVHNKYLAMQQFANLGRDGGSNNILATVTTYDEGGLAKFRAIGVEPENENAKPIPKVVFLKNIGTTFDTDLAIQRGMGNGVGSNNPFDEQQIDQAMNRVINGFVKASMLAEISEDPRNFDGFSAFFKANPTQVITKPYEVVGGLSYNEALRVEEYINKALAKVKDCNEIITTRDGATLLRTINAHRHRGVEVVNVNGLEYNRYMGINIIDLPDDYFEEEDLLNGIPIILGYVNAFDGIRYAIPADGRVFHVVAPNTTRNGVFVARGGIEIMTTPIMVDKFVAAKCYIKEVDEDIVDEGI